MSQHFYFDRALLPEGWASGVRIAVDGRGDIEQVSVSAPSAGATRIGGVALPGMPNLHSHAFQRALAGLAECRSHPQDSFWSWRRVMYDFVARMTPEQLAAVAAQLYLEMLKAGYTSVAEFHYVHRDPEGRRYDDPATLSHAILEAASTTGIGLTHLPVLYLSAGFGGDELAPEQRRFGHRGPGEFLELVEALRAAVAGDPQFTIGIAPHSLRAVPPAALADLLAGWDALAPQGVIHIHIAEQEREVEQCLAQRGARPVQWLLDAHPVDRRWCLVHATHLDRAEAAAAAASGAIAGLCPTTEANLGDGLFPLSPWLAAGGALGVGSDSNSSVSPVEELRWLEYGQRLVARRRNIAADEAQTHVGRNLWERCCRGGGAALGRRSGELASGQRADIVVLDPDHPNLLGRADDTLLDSYLFSGNSNPVKDVLCGGRRVIEAGRHAGEEAIASRFRAAMQAIAGAAA